MDVQVDLQNVSKTLRDETKNLFPGQKIHPKRSTVTSGQSDAPLCDYRQERPDYSIAVIEDINARKLAEKALIENQRFLSSASEHSDGISVLDKDMNTTTVNQTIERLDGHALPLTRKKCFE